MVRHTGECQKPANKLTKPRLDTAAVDLAMDTQWDKRSDAEWTHILNAVEGAIRYILGTRYSTGQMASIMRNSQDDLVQMVMLKLNKPSKFDLDKCPLKNSPRCWGHLVTVASAVVIDAYRSYTAACRDVRQQGALEPSLDWEYTYLNATSTGDRIIERLDELASSGVVDDAAMTRASAALAELGVINEGDRFCLGRVCIGGKQETGE